MRLNIIDNFKPVSPLGDYEIEDITLFSETREVFIDGRKVPDFLGKIILRGMDSMTLDYLNELKSLGLIKNES